MVSPHRKLAHCVQNHLKNCFMQRRDPPLDIIDIDTRLDHRSHTHYLLSASMVAPSLLSSYWQTDIVFVVVVFHRPSLICSNFCFQVAARVLPMWGALGQWRRRDGEKEEEINTGSLDHPSFRMIKKSCLGGWLHIWGCDFCVYIWVHCRTSFGYCVSVFPL